MANKWMNVRKSLSPEREARIKVMVAEEVAKIVLAPDDRDSDHPQDDVKERAS